MSSSESSDSSDSSDTSGQNEVDNDAKMLDEGLKEFTPRNVEELKEFIESFTGTICFDSSHFNVFVMAYEIACKHREDLINGFMSLLSEIVLNTTDFSVTENIDKLRLLIARYCLSYENDVKFKTELLFIWASIEYKYVKSYEVIYDLFERILAIPENREQEFYWLEYAHMADSIDKQRSIFKQALDAHVRNPYAIEAAWRRTEILSNDYFSLSDCIEYCKRAIKEHENRKQQARQKTQVVQNKNKQREPPKVAEETDAFSELPENSCRIYLYNIPFELTESQLLHELTERNISVTSTGIQRKPNTKSRDFGFADLANEDEVKKALALQTIYIKNRCMYISQDPNEGHKYSQPGAVSKQKRTAFVKGLPRDCTEEELKNLFSKYGEILDVRRVRNVAYVEFRDENIAKSAVFNMVLQDIKLRDHELTIAISDPPLKRKADAQVAHYSKSNKRPRTQATHLPRQTAKMRLNLIPTVVRKQIENATEVKGDTE